MEHITCYQDFHLLFRAHVPRLSWLSWCKSQFGEYHGYVLKTNHYGNSPNFDVMPVNVKYSLSLIPLDEHESLSSCMSNHLSAQIRFMITVMHIKGSAWRDPEVSKNHFISKVGGKYWCCRIPDRNGTTAWCIIYCTYVDAIRFQNTHSLIFKPTYEDLSSRLWLLKALTPGPGIIVLERCLLLVHKRSQSRLRHNKGCR